MTEKEQAIRRVLYARMEILDKVIRNAEDNEVREYYKGKRDGMQQAAQLLGETLASIRVELTPTDTNRA